MKFNKLKRSLRITIENPHLLLAHTKGQLFILSHMRSYSTLLGHILGSHQAIAGYTENHIPYHDKYDLLFLKHKVYQATNHPLSQKIVLDKILHNYTVSPTILNQNDTSIIFLLREPEATLKSILNLGWNLGTTLEWCKHPDKVVEYYSNRLNQIEETCKQVTTRALFLKSEKLLTHTDKTLHALTENLNLDNPLREEYQTFKYTGRGKYGDRSNMIKAGKIIRKKRTGHDIPLSNVILEKGKAAYDSCYDTLKQHCEIIP